MADVVGSCAPYDGRGIANAILDVAEREGVAVYRTSLLKLLYFAHGWFLAKTGKALVGQPFEAWQHGPVVRAVYDQIKEPPGSRIRERLEALNPRTTLYEVVELQLDTDVISLLTDVVRAYGRLYAFDLSDLTHDSDSPWSQAWGEAIEGKRPGARISNTEIREYFLRRNATDTVLS